MRLKFSFLAESGPLENANSILNSRSSRESVLKSGSEASVLLRPPFFALTALLPKLAGTEAARVVAGLFAMAGVALARCGELHSSLLC